MAQPQAPLPARDRVSQEPTTELLREAVDDARNLVRLEVALAKDELKTELRAAKSAAIGLGVALVAGVLALATLLMAAAVALGPIVALLVALVLFALAAFAGIAGYRHLPKSPLEATRRRLETDLEKLKEHVA